MDSVSKDNLALLYQGLLTGIVRMQVGRQPVLNADSLRRRTKAALDEVEREAMAAGYERSDIRDAHFAVVAFLDAVVLNLLEPIRAEWERRTLQQELFGQADAGIMFFEKLDHLLGRPDSRQTADVLEVFLLCLLLGFEGRYSGANRGLLFTLAERLRMRIESIRGRSDRLSPYALMPSDAPLPYDLPKADFRLTWWIAPGVITLTLMVYLILSFELSSRIHQIASGLR